MTRDSQAAFRAAEEAIRAVAAAIVPQVANTLLFRVKNAATYRERSLVSAAQVRFVESQDLFLSSFAAFLHEAVEKAVAPDADVGASGGGKAPRSATDWQSIGLVDEGQVEEHIGAKRIGQLITHASERELRELDGYACAAIGLKAADAQRNPLAGDVIGSALQKSIERIADDPATQKILAREVGQAVADAMPGCYRGIVEQFGRLGWSPVALPLKAADAGIGRRPDIATAGDARRGFDASWMGRPPAAPPEPLRSWEQSILGRIPQSEPLPSGADLADAAALLERLMRGGLPAPDRRQGPTAADHHLTDLLRRIAVAAESEPPAAPVAPADGDAGIVADLPSPPSTRSGADVLSELVAVNLIRAHRAELEQGARGKVDHLVIEVVGSLFDQILADARVPPQVARQIARLQLPVLRVALDDPRFFSSRRHPLRRFINRIATLGSAADLTSPSGLSLLARVSALVSEIVEGDFAELEVYEAKLDALQRFIVEQAAEEVEASEIAPTLRDRESEVQSMRGFGAAFAGALEPLGLPGFVRDFLCGPWAQAIVLASRRDGVDGREAQTLRRTAFELVASIQPKRSVDDRRRFVSMLPTLMGALRSGMDRVGWPQSAREAFFGELMTVHAGSLKSPPPSDLEHNLRLRHLEQAVRLPVPADEAGAGEGHGPGSSPTPPMPLPALAAIEPLFTPEEERAIGLVSDAAVDWSQPVDAQDTVPDAMAPPAGVAPAGQMPAAAPADPAPAPASAHRAPVPASGHAGDGALPSIDLGLLDSAIPAPKAAVGVAAAAPAPVADPDEPELAAGAGLRDHLQLGHAYRLNLKGGWETVRLTYMSPSRTLFLFRYGAQQRESVSMTARTLARLCEAGRMRASEAAYLVERSTDRAKAQLAAAPGATPRGAPARG